MTERIDVFAHVLPPKFYQSMLKIDPQIPQKFPFINIKSLSDIGVRRANFDGATKQVISAVNINPEDFVDGEQAANLCRQANNEMATMITQKYLHELMAEALLPQTMTLFLRQLLITTSLFFSTRFLIHASQTIIWSLVGNTNYHRQL